MENFRQMLATKANNATFAGPRGSITVNNPWVAEEQTVGVQVSQSILVKFWAQLTTNGITFEVDGLKAIASSVQPFAQLVDNETLNILGLSRGNVGQTSYVMLGERYLKYGEDYVSSTDLIVANAKYTTTDIQPSAE